MNYVIIKNSGSCGIAGYIWQVLRAIWHNPNYRYYIDFTQGCQYQDSKVTHTSNVWEYYFQQPHTTTYPSSSEIKLIVDAVIDVPESEFRDVYMANPTEEFINTRRKEFNDIIKTYLKLQPHLENRINNFVRDHFEGKRVLGVHLRGTDHPAKRNVYEYIQTIQQKAVDYDVIFCMSDEFDRYSTFKAAFGDKVVCLDSIKSKTGRPLHYDYLDTSYQIGEDVIAELYILSNTDFIFCCGNSNVNYLSRAINPFVSSQAL